MYNNKVGKFGGTVVMVYIKTNYREDRKVLIEIGFHRISKEGETMPQWGSVPKSNRFKEVSLHDYFLSSIIIHYKYY